MKSIIAERIKNMQPSATLAMAAKSRALAAEGIDMISLSLGEPDFDTPDFIKQAAKEALDAGYTKYTPVAGLLELREAIVEKFKRDNGLTYTTDQIIVSNGANRASTTSSTAYSIPAMKLFCLRPTGFPIMK